MSNRTRKKAILRTMLLAAVGLGAVGVVQRSIEPRADAVPITVGTIGAQMSNQEGITGSDEPDGTTESNCIRYAPSNTSTSSQFVTSPGEALTSHGRTGGTCPASLDVDQQSALGVAPVPGSSVVNGDPFLLAEITHYNRAVEGSGAAIYRGTTSLSFGDFDGDPVVSMSWRMWETPDSPKPCPFGGGPGGACRDQVAFTIPSESFTMTRGGLGYRLILGDLVPVEGEEACPTTPPIAVMAEETTPNSLSAREGAQARGCLYGTISQGRLVTVAKRIEGIETDVIAPSATFGIESVADPMDSPWNTSFELTPPADGTDSADPLVLTGSESATLTEDLSKDPRWELTDIECVDFDAEGDPRPLPEGATYDVENRELILAGIPAADYEDDGSITCTFVNTYTPMTTLTLVKEVADGEATTEDFTLTATGVDGTPTEDVVVSGVSGSDDVTDVMVPAGEYVLSEEGPSGYLSPDGWDCGTAEMDGDSVTVVDGADVVCTIVNEIEREEISLGKVPSRTFFTAAGQVITYTYTITNSGNLTLGPGQFKVTDDRIDSGVAFNCGASTVELDPDETVTCTRDYTSTAADVTAGEITNEAFASLGELDSETVSATVDFAVLLIAKSPSPTTVSTAGQTITYTYTLTNNGSESLGPDQFKVSDNKINGGTAFNCGPAVTTLAVAGTLSCTATYTVTAADITAGSIVNVASASGGGVTSPTATATVTVVAPPPIIVPPIVTVPVTPAEVPSIRLAKSASPAFFFLAGDVITYTYTVTNDGTKALGPFQFKVTDNRINGGKAFNCGAANTTLAAKATLTCTAIYTITAADVAAGSVTNSAFASAGTAVSNTVTATVTGEKILFPSELPVTGSDSDASSLIALVSLGFGLGLLALVRRRRVL